MNIALTIWGNRISPVFDSAQSLLIAQIHKETLVQKDHAAFSAKPSTLSENLRELGISVLICGAISKVPADIISSSGIILIPFITGNAEDILELYLNDAPVPNQYLMPGSPYYTESKSNRLNCKTLKGVNLK